MVTRRKKTQRKPSKKGTRRTRQASQPARAKHIPPRAADSSRGQSAGLRPLAGPGALSQSPSRPDHRVFSIEIGAINGETTIGDLIVAFPRTREVLMKHGLRFDVEEAGYLYMTLSVFSAIHGLSSPSLVEELHMASKETLPQVTVQQLRPIATAPTP